MKRERAIEAIAALCDDLVAEAEALDVLLHGAGSAGRAAAAALASSERRMVEALGIPFDPSGAPSRLADVARSLSPRTRVPWHGGPMSLTWALQSRLASTWALVDQLAAQHGTERRPPSHHIVDLALTMLPYNFLLSGQPAPEATIRIDLSAPGSSMWGSTNARPGGPAPSDNSVRGPALDFCRLACGRATRAEATLVTHGDVADAWLDVVDALAYSAPLDDGR
jgi:hypothetical protein